MLLNHSLVEAAPLTTYPIQSDLGQINYWFGDSEYLQLVGREHKGMDLVYRDGSSGGIYSSGDGVVIQAEGGCQIGNRDCGGGWGNYALVDHGNGLSTVYAHLSSLSVSTGDNVAAGQQIGLMGTTGRSDGVHLHFEVLENGNKVDPYSYFDWSTFAQLHAYNGNSTQGSGGSTPTNAVATKEEATSGTPWATETARPNRDGLPLAEITGVTSFATNFVFNDVQSVNWIYFYEVNRNEEYQYTLRDAQALQLPAGTYEVRVEGVTKDDGTIATSMMDLKEGSVPVIEVNLLSDKPILHVNNVEIGGDDSGVEQVVETVLATTQENITVQESHTEASSMEISETTETVVQETETTSLASLTSEAQLEQTTVENPTTTVIVDTTFHTTESVNINTQSITTLIEQSSVSFDDSHEEKVDMAVLRNQLAGYEPIRLEFLEYFVSQDVLRAIYLQAMNQTGKDYYDVETRRMTYLALAQYYQNEPYFISVQEYEDYIQVAKKIEAQLGINMSDLNTANPRNIYHYWQAALRLYKQDKEAIKRIESYIRKERELYLARRKNRTIQPTLEMYRVISIEEAMVFLSSQNPQINDISTTEATTVSETTVAPKDHPDFQGEGSITLNMQQQFPDKQYVVVLENLTHQVRYEFLSTDSHPKSVLLGEYKVSLRNYQDPNGAGWESHFTLSNQSKEMVISHHIDGTMNQSENPLWNGENQGIEVSVEKEGVSYVRGGVQRVETSISPQSDTLEEVQVSRVYNGSQLQLKSSTAEGDKLFNAVLINVQSESLNPYGQSALERTFELVSNAKTIQIERDAGSRKDPYNKDYVYLWVDGHLLQEVLLKEGYGKIDASLNNGNTRYLNALMQVEKEARESKRGLWENITTIPALATDSGIKRETQITTTQITTETTEETTLKPIQKQVVEKKQDGKGAMSILVFSILGIVSILLVGVGYILYNKKKNHMSEEEVVDEEQDEIDYFNDNSNPNDSDDMKFF